MLRIAVAFKKKKAKNNYFEFKSIRALLNRLKKRKKEKRQRRFMLRAYTNFLEERQENTEAENMREERALIVSLYGKGESVAKEELIRQIYWWPADRGPAEIGEYEERTRFRKALANL